MTRTAVNDVGQRTLNLWRVFAVALTIAFASVSCSATGGETVISADTSTTPTEVPADQPLEPTPEPTAETPTETPTAVPEPTLAAPTATAVPTVETPQRLVVGTATRGAIADADQPALFEFGAEVGDTIELTVEPLDEDLDVVVDVIDRTQQSIIGGELDDSFGTESIRGVVIEETGTFTVVVSSFGDAIGDVSVLVDFMEAIPAGQLVRFGQVVQVEVTASDTVGQTAFAADQGEWIDITVVPLDELDVLVDVRDVTGVSLLANGPVDSSFDTERIRVLEMPADGIYSVVVSGYQGATGSAEVVVERALKDFGTLLRGTDSIDDPAESQDFPFNALAGDAVRLVVDPDDIDHDVVLSIIDGATGDVLDDVDASTGLEELTIEVPRDGDYYFQVSSFEDSVGGFAFILLAPETTVLALDDSDLLTGRLGRASSLQYSYQPFSSGALTVTADALDGTQLTLGLFDTAQEQIVDGEDAVGDSQVLTHQVAADVVYLIDVASPGGGSFELGLTLD